MSFQNKVALIFTAALLLLAGLGFLSVQKVNQEEADQKWVEHTRLVLEKLEELSASVAQEEARQQENTISSQKALLELQQKLSDLRNLTSDNRTQQVNIANVEGFIASRFGALQEYGRVSTGHMENGVAGGAKAGEIEAAIRDMKAEERRLLAARVATRESSLHRVKLVLAAGYLLSLFLIAVAVVVMRSESGKRQQYEKELRKAQEENRSLFENNPVPVWAYDTESLKILDVNERAINHYGFSRQEFLSLKITDIRPSEDIPALLEDIARRPDRLEQSGAWRHRKKSGEIIEVEIKSYPLKLAGKMARVVAAFDVTEQNRVERALRENEERFRLLVSNVKDYAILTLDVQGNIVTWNEGAERIKGYKAEEIIGQHFSVFYPPEAVREGKAAAALAAAAGMGRMEDEGWRLRKDGSVFWAHVVITALHDEGGKLRGFGKITQDITEQRRVSQELQRVNQKLRQANQELESFSYSVSHDLRAPLRAIDGFSQALLEDYGKQVDATGQDYLQRVRVAAQRMGTLIDDLLNLSRVTRVEMHREWIDISQLAKEIGAELQNGCPDRSASFTIEPNLHAEGDAHLIRVALENLLGNSWKFTGKQESARIEFGECRKNGVRAFFVRDNGAGFDGTQASRLFGAFQRLHSMRDFPGTGIGLATVQRIIQRHGGRIWAEGLVGKGATFYFTLSGMTNGEEETRSERQGYFAC